MPTTSPVLLGHVAEHRRVRAEEHVLELRLRGHGLLGRPLVLGQLAHEADAGRGRRRGAAGRITPRR